MVCMNFVAMQIRQLGDGGRHPGGEAAKLNGASSAPTRDERSDGCELSLSLPLPHPSAQRSNASSVSEISETISPYSSVKDSSGSSYNKQRVNLDLSLALCGA